MAGLGGRPLGAPPPPRPGGTVSAVAPPHRPAGGVSALAPPRGASTLSKPAVSALAPAPGSGSAVSAVSALAPPRGSPGAPSPVSPSRSGPSVASALAPPPPGSQGSRPLVSAPVSALAPPVGGRSQLTSSSVLTSSSPALPKPPQTPPKTPSVAAPAPPLGSGPATVASPALPKPTVPTSPPGSRPSPISAYAPPMGSATSKPAVPTPPLVSGLSPPSSPAPPPSSTSFQKPPLASALAPPVASPMLPPSSGPAPASALTPPSISPALPAAPVVAAPAPPQGLGPPGVGPAPPQRYPPVPNAPAVPAPAPTPPPTLPGPTGFAPAPPVTSSGLSKPPLAAALAPPLASPTLPPGSGPAPVSALAPPATSPTVPVANALAPPVVSASSPLGSVSAPVSALAPPMGAAVPPKPPVASALAPPVVPPAPAPPSGSASLAQPQLTSALAPPLVPPTAPAPAPPPATASPPKPPLASALAPPVVPPTAPALAPLAGQAGLPTPPPTNALAPQAPAPPPGSAIPPKPPLASALAPPLVPPTAPTPAPLAGCAGLPPPPLANALAPQTPAPPAGSASPPKPPLASALAPPIVPPTVPPPAPPLGSATVASPTLPPSAPPPGSAGLPTPPLASALAPAVASPTAPPSAPPPGAAGLPTPPLATALGSAVSSPTVSPSAPPPGSAGLPTPPLASALAPPVASPTVPPAAPPPGSAGLPTPPLASSLAQPFLVPPSASPPTATIPQVILKSSAGDFPDSEKEAARKHWVDSWYDRSDCRTVLGKQSVLSEPDAKTLYVVRVTNISDIEVPIAFRDTRGGRERAVLAERSQEVQAEAPKVLALNLRLSFVHAPPGGPVESYGHTYIGPQLAVQNVIVGQVSPSTLKTTVKIIAAAEPPNSFLSQTFFFYAREASPNHQLLVELLVQELPLPVEQAPDQQQLQQKQAQQQKQRRWYVDYDIAEKGRWKSKRSAPKKQAGQTAPKKAPKGGRAEPAPPGIKKIRAQSTNAKASASQQVAVDEYLEPLELGWTNIRFDNATECRKTRPKLELKHESLRSTLLQSLRDGVTPSTLKEEDRKADLLAFMKHVNAKSKPAGLIEYDVTAMPIPTVARHLLASDMPVPLTGEQLSGIKSNATPAGHIELTADIPETPDFLLKEVCITFPDLGYKAFLEALASTSTKDIKTNRKSVNKQDNKASSAWRLHELQVFAGTHNGLRWLTRFNKKDEKGIPASHWRLDLKQRDDGLTWYCNYSLWESSQPPPHCGAVPLEFLCVDECALIFELVAVIQQGNVGATDGELTAKTVGWLLLLPRWHTPAESYTKAIAAVKAGQVPTLSYDLIPMSHSACPLSDRKAWQWKPDSKQGIVAPGVARVSFKVDCSRLVDWLRKSNWGQSLERAPVPERVEATLSRCVVLIHGLRELATPTTKDLHVKVLLNGIEKMTSAAKAVGKSVSWVSENEFSFDFKQQDKKITQSALELQLQVFENAGSILGKITKPLRGAVLNAWNTYADPLAAGSSSVLDYLVFLSPDDIIQPAKVITSPSTPLVPPPAATGPTVGAVQAMTTLLNQPPTAKDVELSKQGVTPIPPPLPLPGPVQPVVSQPSPPSPVPPVGTLQPTIPADLQTVVERVYLRDQGTQSDPPPLPGPDEQYVIGEGSAPSAYTLDQRRKYTGPAMQPVAPKDRLQLLQGLGDTQVGRLLQGLPPGGESRQPRRDLRWKFEEEDPLQADELTVEFLTHRSLFGSFGERVFFQLRLFQFPPARTATSVLTGGPGEACLLRSAVTNERVSFVYLIDGAGRLQSTSASGLAGAAEIHRQLMEYLSARSAEVEIWSADAMMQIGIVTVALEPLVRQGQPVIKMESECPVLDPMSGEARGFLKMVFTNRGRQPQPLAKLTPATAPATTIPSSKVAAGGERSRSRHKAGTMLPKGADPSNVVSVRPGEDPDEASKKQQRLKQLKLIRRVEVADKFSDHTALLSAAEEVRHDRKKEEVARRMDRFTTSETTILAAFGTPSIFHAEFHNPYSKPASFTVSVMERGVQVCAPGSAPPAPVQGILSAVPEPPLALVTDPEEWKRLVVTRRVPPPPGGDYTRLAGRGMFTLNSQETVCLPFRYLAFDHPGLHGSAHPMPANGISLADITNVASTEVPDRNFIIQVHLHQGPQMKRVEVKARPQPCAVDRTIRFFEAEGSPIEKTLAMPVRPITALCNPANGAGANTTTTEHFVYCTNKDVHVQRREEGELLIRLLVPGAPKTKSFFMICYADQYFTQVTAVELIEVQGLKREDIRVCVGQSVERSICVAPAEVLDSQAVRLYSSDPETVAVQHAADVDPRFGAKFTVTVTALHAGQQTCRIQAVDPATRRLIAAFLLVIAADLPEVRVVHEISLPVLTTMVKKLAYKNEATRPMRYAIRSSNPAVITVNTPDMLLAARDTRYIELLFHACPATLSYSAEVFIFITSQDRAIQETRLLQLTYT